MTILQKSAKSLIKTIKFKATVLAAGAAIGIVLGPSLSGCGAGDGPVSQVMGYLGVKDAGLTNKGKSELARFRAVYRKYTGASSGSKQFRNFVDAYKLINADYVRYVPEAKLINAAIKGVREIKDPKRPEKPEVVIESALDSMVGSLDPHSAYLNAGEFRDMQISTRGVFGGLGIEVTLEKGLVKVISPIEDTPAFRAGLRTGDIITHLDGRPIKGHTLYWAVNIMRGEPGTSIRLTVRRAGVPSFDVAIVRAIIRVKAVRWRVDGNIGYLRVTRFNERTMAGVEKAMSGMSGALKGKLKGLVLDLRDNPGGLLDQSVYLADAFLQGGRIVSVRGRGEKKGTVFNASPGDMAHGVPMVVLINGGSASASEIVASALQDQHRAMVLGSRSFGKGSVQTIMPLPIEGALKLTTQLYYAPSGRSIQANGVEPNIRLLPEIKKKSADKAKRKHEADLPGALAAVDKAQTKSARSVREADCPPAVDVKRGKKDYGLGCALAFLRAGSAAGFLAAVGANAAM
jgi:carboxyl-terminal processing protease